MTLTRMTLDGPVDIVKRAIEDIKEHEPKNGYYVANSFGKDSGVVHRLMELAEVTFDAHHNFTTVDPPELIRHGLKNYPDTEIHRPKIPMWDLIVKKGFPPTRMIRYCCSILKERGGAGSPCRHRETKRGITGTLKNHADRTIPIRSPRGLFQPDFRMDYERYLGIHSTRKDPILLSLRSGILSPWVCRVSISGGETNGF